MGNPTDLEGHIYCAELLFYLLLKHFFGLYIFKTA